MDIQFLWVKGHADLLNQPLSRDERLNMVIDQHADKTRSDDRGPTAAQPACYHWDVEITYHSLRGGKLTSQYKEKIKTQLHDKSITAFIKEKESWTQQTFDTVNWSACGIAFKRLSKKQTNQLIQSMLQLLAYRRKAYNLLSKGTTMLFL
jgi:hypothetical protein